MRARLTAQRVAVAGLCAFSGMAHAAVTIEWSVTIPARDGIKLAANVYRPESGTPGPSILTMTPYTADRYHKQAMYFAKNGYTFVVVDVRGRGNSGGEYWPYEKDAQDGYDIVEWMTKQSWSNGKVGMWGGSAAGFNQWQTLKEFPKGLATIVPTASGHPGFDMPAYKNIFTGWSLNWFSSVNGRVNNNNFEGDLDYWTDAFRAHYVRLQPFNQLDKRVGMPAPQFQRWLEHPSVDAYWDALVPNAEQYKRMDVPILTITGHHDGVQRGAIEFQQLHMRYGNKTAKARHYLVIGPWNHAGTRKPVIEFGGVKFGPQSLVDIDQLHLDWYGWTLRGGPKPAFLRDQVNYYVEEADEWRSAPALDALGTKPRKLYLSSSGLQDKPVPKSSSNYLYDPKDTRAGAVEPMYSSDYLLDTSPVKNLFGAGVVFETAPLQANLTIAGRMRADLWIEMDAPDTDIEALLYQIRPDGTSIRLAHDHVRVRYRDSLRDPKPAPINKPFRIVLPNFHFFARRIEKGSRLQLLVHAPNSIYTQKNFNSGADVSGESGENARPVRVVIHQGGNHASVLDVPIFE